MAAQPLFHRRHVVECRQELDGDGDVCVASRGEACAVAPFKAQNMSNHSYPCRDGGEIGRAQVAQAEACGLEPEPAMNPILLKPNGAGSSQVIVNGRVWKTLPPRGYYAARRRVARARPRRVRDLARRFDVIVIEGAGSVTELNLRDVDLVNLGLVTRLRAPWLLVADIERGGVFASVIGTVGLLTAEERALFRGFAINKFRGDVSLFDDGVRILEERTGVPLLRRLSACAGHRRRCRGQPGAADEPGDRGAAGRAHRHRPFAVSVERAPTSVCSRGPSGSRRHPPPTTTSSFCRAPRTRSPTCEWLRQVGLDDWIRGQHRRGATVIGICGGFQMLGRTILDPYGMESSTRRAEGLALLPAETVLAPTRPRRSRRRRRRGGVRFSGYEIHLGVTTLESACEPFARLAWRRRRRRLRGSRRWHLPARRVRERRRLRRGLRRAGPGVRDKGRTLRRLAEWFERHGRGLSELGLS